MKSHHHVRLGLGVGPFVPNPKFASIIFPGDLDLLFEQTIFGPIRNKKREIASYSVILYGPPGTSKTTIAQLISQRLAWPLLKQQ